MRMTLGEVLEVTGGQRVNGSPEDWVTGISTDSRNLRPGDLFFALRGPHHDGHQYLAEVFQKGASGAVVDHPVPQGKNIVQVSDTLKALGDLARGYRRKFPITVVAVTGSNGKTTTKDMTAAILETSYRVLKTEGNFNNLIGLPLTLFRLDEKDEVAVLEMGMNQPGEIDRLAEIAAPSVGVITNVARAHLGRLGSLARIAHAKGELLRRLPKEGLAILNADDPSSKTLKKISRCRVVTFGKRKEATVQLRSSRLEGLKEVSFSALVGGKKGSFRMPVLGRQNISNVLAALAVADHLGVPLSKMKKGVASFRTESKRMEILHLPRKIILINDCYNANPDSMAEALRFLQELGGVLKPALRRRALRGRLHRAWPVEGATRAPRRLIAVLGDMLELGHFTRRCHYEVGIRAAKAGVDLLFAVGEQAGQILRGAKKGGFSPSRCFAFEATDEAVRKAVRTLQSEILPGDILLIKGSRGVKMERVTEGLKDVL